MRMSQRLGRWVSYGALLSGCSTWVELETPMPPKASAGGTAGAAGRAGADAPSDRAGSGAMSSGSPGVGPAGGNSSNEGGNSSAGGGAKNDPAPGLFDPLDPPLPPVLLPPDAESADIWTAETQVVEGHLNGALLGTVDYTFRRPSMPEHVVSGTMRTPFLWTDANGMVMLDRLLPDIDTYDPMYVNDDGSLVIGKYTSRDGNHMGVFRWTPSGGATKFGPAYDDGSFQLWFSEKADVVVFSHLAAQGLDEVVRWTAESGFETISEAPGWPIGHVQGMNAGGSTLVGYFGDDPTVASAGIFRWTLNGFELLGSPPGLINCYPDGGNEVSPDGKVLFGQCASADGNGIHRNVFRWSEAEGFTVLANEDKTCFMTEAIIAADATVAFGPALCGTEWRLMRWSMGSAPTLLPASAAMGLSFEQGSFTDVDDSGSSACGAVCQPGDVMPCDAFRWGKDTGYVRLPLLVGQNQGIPRAIDPTGRAIVGWSAIAGDNQSLQAILWESGEALGIQTYLMARGVDLGGRQLSMAQDVAIQGDTILMRGHAGLGEPARDWIARIPLVR